MSFLSGVNGTVLYRVPVPPRQKVLFLGMRSSARDTEPCKLPLNSERKVCRMTTGFSTHKSPLAGGELKNRPEADGCDPDSFRSFNFASVLPILGFG